MTCPLTYRTYLPCLYTDESCFSNALSQTSSLCPSLTYRTYLPCLYTDESCFSNALSQTSSLCPSLTYRTYLPCLYTDESCFSNALSQTSSLCPSPRGLLSVILGSLSSHCIAEINIIIKNCQIMYFTPGHRWAVN